MPKTTKSQKTATAADTEKATSPGDRLVTYRAKRHFAKTPEPAPGGGGKHDDDEDGSSQRPGPEEKKTASPLEFVVQKHDARRLHYDVRLEVGGAMVSWAVPKGPSYDPAVRRLAVQTEDHPMEYNAFEGRIPDGEYGAGDVLIWDRGRYETVPAGQEHAMLEKGHFHVRFFGEKLAGEWHLIRTSFGGRSARGREGGARGDGGSLDDGAGGTGKAQWLMFKAKDAHASAQFDVVAERPESVVSGDRATRGPGRVGASAQGTSALALAEAVGEPALATAVKALSSPKDWLFEVKYDGYRLLACKAGGEVRLFTRRSNDWTDRFTPVARAVAQLHARECVVDGEACIVDEAGQPSFGALQAWLAAGSKGPGLVYAVFDVLWLDGRDLRGQPIEARRELLSKLVAGAPSPITLSSAVAGDLGDLLRAAKSAGLEGLMAKRKGSAYVGGRSSASSAQWVKLRFERRQECVIAGWLPLSSAQQAAKNQMGALMCAVAEDGKLVYAGRVGTGFDARAREDLARRLSAHPVKAPEVEGAPKLKDAHWVTPTLVCECAFGEWTGDRMMRHPRFIGLREDKAPLDCVRESEIDVAASAEDGAMPEEPKDEPHETAPLEAAPPKTHATPPHAPHARPHAPPAPHAKSAPATAAGGAKLSNPDKVLFPRDGITKRDIWSYIEAIAPVMLPHLAGRPLTMQRYPDGIDGEEWYQQNAPEKSPPYVRLIDVGPRHDKKKRIACDDLESAKWLANLAALTLHTWCVHVPPEATTRAEIDRWLQQPDYVVLDLDPGSGPWSHLVEVARAVRTLLDALKLESFPKTSGKRGVHVIVPFAPGPTHDQATGFAEQVARAVAKVLPDIATVERMKEKRFGKLYVDYGQNGEGRTVVAPYTIRARDGAIVSTPITWDELTEDLDPTKFTIRTTPARVAEVGDLFAGVLRREQRLPAV